MKEIVYKGHNNTNTIVVKKNGTPLPFTDVTRMVCEFSGTDVVADTQADSSLIDWSQGGGKLVFNLGGLSVPAGEREATLIVYETAHPNGIIRINKRIAPLTFVFED
jgi:hypothetical protein